MKKPNLTQAQQRVMHWLSQGWGARVSSGAAVEVNGDRICNVDTMTVLVRLGLAERESRPPYWMATAEGRKMRPSYLHDQATNDRRTPHEHINASESSAKDS